MEDNNDTLSTTHASIIDNSRRDLSPPSAIQTRGTDDVVPHSTTTSSSGHGRHRRQMVQDNGSETESDTDNKSYPDQSRGPRDGSDRHQHNLSGHGDQPHYREPVSANDDSNKRGGPGSSSVLSNLLARPGLDNSNKPTDHHQQPPPTLPQLGLQSSGDVRLPAISLHPPSSLGSYNSSSRVGPPPLLDQPGQQLNDLHRVSSSNGAGGNSPPGISSRPRPDIASHRSNWNVPPSRPNTIDGLDRPGSPRSTSYGSTNPNAAHVSAGRDDFDYPTYQPPESLVGQRIAKTFAGHGRFVGQVVKYNSQTELFTVVYADGDTEELTRENTMNLLIEDKRIHQSKAREPMRKLAEQQHPGMSSAPKTGPPFKPALTERDVETLNALFERHAWPALAENGWRSDVQGSTLYVYPPWSGTNSREPEYFTSVVDTIMYLTSHAELLRLCFPVEVQSTLFAVLDGLRHNAKRGAQEAGPAPGGVMKRIKAESPSSHPSAIRSLSSAPLASRPPYFDQQHHHHQQQQQGYPESYPAESMRRQHAEPPNSHPSRYPRMHGEDDPRQSRSGYAPPPSTMQPPANDHRFPPPGRHIRDDGFPPQRPSHQRGPDFDLRHRPSAVGGFVNPPLASHSPHHGHADVNAPRPIAQHHFSHPDSRIAPSQAPPQLAHPSSFNEARSENPSVTAAPRFSQPPPRPIGQPQRSNVISMSDLDKSAPLTATVQTSRPPMGDQPQPRLRMYPNDQHPQSLPPQSSAPYARIRGNDWSDDQRYNPNDQSSSRREHHDRLYAADRFGPRNTPPEGYYEEANQPQQQQQGFPGRTTTFPRVEPTISNPSVDHPQDYKYSRRLQ